MLTTVAEVHAETADFTQASDPFLAKEHFEDETHDLMFVSVVQSNVEEEIKKYAFITKDDVHSFFMWSDCMTRIRTDWQFDFDMCFYELSL